MTWLNDVEDDDDEDGTVDDDDGAVDDDDCSNCFAWLIFILLVTSVSIVKISWSAVATWSKIYNNEADISNSLWIKSRLCFNASVAWDSSWDNCLDNIVVFEDNKLWFCVICLLMTERPSFTRPCNSLHEFR